MRRNIGSRRLEGTSSGGLIMELYDNGRLVDSGTPRVWELTDFTAGVRNTEQVAFQMNRALSIIEEDNVIQSTRPTMMIDGTVISCPIDFAIKHRCIISLSLKPLIS